MLLSYHFYDGHLHVRVMSMFYNWGSIIIGVDGSRLLRCHGVIIIYILLGISNLDVGMTLFPSMILPLVKHGIKYLRLKKLKSLKKDGLIDVNVCVLLHVGAMGFK